MARDRVPWKHPRVLAQVAVLLSSDRAKMINEHHLLALQAFENSYKSVQKAEKALLCKKKKLDFSNQN